MSTHICPKTLLEMVSEGHQTLLETVDLVRMPLLQRARMIAEYADLGGYEATPYEDLLRSIDASIKLLKTFRSEVSDEAKHTHKWNDHDVCSVCGADGRA